MIIGTLDNIKTYKHLSSEIEAGLTFLKEAVVDIPLGVYNIKENVKAIVTEYTTIKSLKEGFEAHKNVIDIQYPIIGLERVYWSPIKEMSINIPYDKAIDRTFYLNPSPQATHVDIGNGVFAIMFPEDGHSPMHYIDKPELIKKITIKIAI